jgi:hypothetical protein
MPFTLLYSHLLMPLLYCTDFIQLEYGLNYATLAAIFPTAASIPRHQQCFRTLRILVLRLHGRFAATCHGLAGKSKEQPRLAHNGRSSLTIPTIFHY